MTAQEVEVMIAQGEGYNIEFKQAIPSKASDLADEICAFANAAGGVVLIGVTDKGAVTGITLDKQTRSRLQNVLNTIESRLETVMHEVRVQGKTVLCIECNPGKQKLYTVSGSIIMRKGPTPKKLVRWSGCGTSFSRPLK